MSSWCTSKGIHKQLRYVAMTPLECSGCDLATPSRYSSRLAARLPRPAPTRIAIPPAFLVPALERGYGASPQLEAGPFARRKFMRTLFASILIIGLIGCAPTAPSVLPVPSAPPPQSVKTPAKPETSAAAPLAYLSQLPPLIDREALFDDPEIAGGQLSPNGKWISFRKPYRGVMNVWVKGIDQKFSDGKPLTGDTKRPIIGYFWSQDSKYVLYVQDKGGDENYRVYAVDPAAKAEEEAGVPIARDLTPFEKVRAAIYAVPKRDPRH